MHHEVLRNGVIVYVQHKKANKLGIVNTTQGSNIKCIIQPIRNPIYYQNLIF